MSNVLRLSFLILIFTQPLAFAGASHSHHHTEKKIPVISHSINMLLKQKPVRLQPNRSEFIIFQLIQNDKIVTLDDLKEVHTHKIHVLLIDNALKDYHHIHPSYDSQSKTFSFHFLPKYSDSYQIWADVTPITTNQQSFTMIQLGAPSERKIVTQKTLLQTQIPPYEFTMKFNNALKAGNTVIASITVTKNGHPYSKLQPVMGTFAHLIGFNGDHASILHTHALGKHPSKDNPYGGPTFRFQVELNKKGFVKFFAQFKADGKDVYVPFGIQVK